VVSTGSPVTLVAGEAHSADSAPLAAGSYAYRAHYTSSDPLFASADGLCEPFSVAQTQLSLESQVHDAAHVDRTSASVPLNSVMHDTAKLSGAVAGFTAPAITFLFFPN